MDRFGEKLRALRHRKKWTLKRLAAQMDYRAHGYLSEIESGKRVPTTQFVLRVSRLFGVSCDVLMKDELDLGD